MEVTTRRIVRIIPGQAAGGQPLVHGTKVILDDGSILEGITCVELVANPGDSPLWQVRLSAAAEFMSAVGAEQSKV